MSQKFEQTCVSLLVSSCECPACRSIMRPPLRLCAGGHTFCSSCALSYRYCTVCRSPFTNYKQSVFEKVLSIVSCVCKHAKSGCTLFLDKACKEAHERICEWRLTTCVWCSWSGSLNKWKDHIITEHGARALCEEDEGIKTMPLGVDVDKALFSIKGVLFCMFAAQDRDAPLFLVLQCFPTSDRHLDTVFSVSVVNQGLHFSQSIHPISDSVPRTDVFLNLDQCIIIPGYIKKGKAHFAFAISVDDE